MSSGIASNFDPMRPLANTPRGFVPPNPGGGAAHEEPLGPRADAGGAASPRALSGSNALVAAANPLLNLVPQIKATAHHPDPARLRELLLEEIRLFEQRAREAGIASETIIGARYCLCTTLDEAANLTPWGGAGVWSAQSLLVTFHNETWGGEKFFQLLARLSHHPQQHIDLLELQYFCLALGFEGRYRVLDQGRSQLDVLKQRLLQLIRNTRGEHARALSPHWADAPIAATASKVQIPLWAVAAVAAVLCLALFGGLKFALAGRSDALFASIDQLRLPRVLSVAAPVNPAANPAPKPRLAQFLEPEIREGLVTVRDEADRSVVILRGDGLFDSGSAAFVERHKPVLLRVAEALESQEGPVTVAGYTDDVPTRGLRFASNWELSQARAEAVKALLLGRLSHAERARAEGRGAADPLVPNDSAANRARNRRVEITLMLPPKGSATEEPRS